MTLLTLINHEQAVVSTDQLVYTAEETSALLNVVATSERINEKAENHAKATKALQSEAIDKGYNEGLEQGRADAQKALANALKELHTRNATDQSALREQGIQLAIDIVRRIGLAAGGSKTVASLARQAAEELLPQQQAILRVPAADIEAVSDIFRESPPIGCHIEVREDPSLTSGECALDTDSGTVHAGLETQLRVIGDNLIERMHADGQRV